MNKNCEYCGNEFFLNRKDKKYCSKYCKQRHKTRKNTYGVTTEEYNIMYDKQHGCCAICGRHQSKFKIRLGIDHNHNTGKVRGLLCQRCNTVLSKYNEDIEIFKKFIRYLK